MQFIELSKEWQYINKRSHLTFLNRTIYENKIHIFKRHFERKGVMRQLFGCYRYLKFTELRLTQLRFPLEASHTTRLKILNRKHQLVDRQWIYNNILKYVPSHAPSPWNSGSQTKALLLQSERPNKKGTSRTQQGSGNTNGKNGDNKEKHINKNKLNRKANLGSTIEMLQLKVPKLLQELLPEGSVSKNIIFRILPHKYPKMPLFKGYLLYSTTLKTLQLALTSFYLNPKTRIHITNIKVDEPTSSMSSDELVNLSLNNTSIEKADPSINHTAQSLSNYTTKIIIKWRTCLNGCPHLDHSSTAHAKMGSFKFDNLDMSKVLPESGKNLSSALVREIELNLFPGFLQRKNKKSEIKEEMAQKSDRKLERIVSGVFIFELTADNDKIAVFTIDNCDVLENKEPDIERFGLAPQA